MNLLKKIKSFAVLLFVCTFLISISLTSCGKGQAAKEESTEHPAAEDAEKAEHPEGADDAEHPTKNDSDSTKVEAQK